MKQFIFLVVVLVIGGCTSAPQLVPGPAPIKESPAANLPKSLRAWNWVDANGSGSCVHASFVYHLRWQNELQLADWWKSKYAGGETASSIRRKCDAAGVRYRYTESADEEFLNWCTATRRGAIIWYYPAHCVHFCGFGKDRGGNQVAWICDNNRIARFIAIPRREFVRNWAGFGGFALSAIGQVEPFEPVPAPLVPAHVTR